MEHLKGALLGRTTDLRTNIGLGWKCLPETDTLVYYEKFVNYGHKKFYNIGIRPADQLTGITRTMFALTNALYKVKNITGAIACLTILRGAL